MCFLWQDSEGFLFELAELRAGHLEPGAAPKGGQWRGA